MTQPPPGNGPPQYGGQPPFGQPGYGHPQYSGGQPPAAGPPGYPGGYDQQPPKKNTGLIIAVGVIVLLLIAGAVGGFLLLRDDNKDTDSTAKEESTSAPPTSADSTPAPTTAAPATSVTPPAGDAYCDTMRDYDNELDLANGDFTSPTGKVKLLEVMDGLEAVAPVELQADYQVVTDGLNAVQEGRPQELDQAAFLAAFGNIGVDAQQRCGISMGG